jgi:VanZ family protein
VQVANVMKFSKVLPAIALLFALPFFFIGGPDVAASPLFHVLWDCGHIVFFALLALLLVQHFSLSSWRGWLLFTLLVFVLGGAIEVVQSHTGRNGSWQDLLRDLTGTWLGLFLIRSKQPWVYAGRLLAVGVLSVNLYWVGLTGAGFWYAHYEFPVLADFESPLSMQTMRANGLRDRVLRDKSGKVIAGENPLSLVKTHIERSRDYASNGVYGLKIRMGNQRYSGVVFNQVITDWS